MGRVLKDACDTGAESLLKEAPDDLRKQIFQEIGGLDERISGEEMDLLENSRAWKKKW